MEGISPLAEDYYGECLIADGDQAMKANLIRFLTFAAIWSSWTYVPIFAKTIGIDDYGIGLMVASYSLSLFLSSILFGYASDKYGGRIWLIVGLISSSLTFFLQLFAGDFLDLLLIRVLTGFCIGLYPASLIAYVYKRKGNLSRFSSFGSLGWTFGVLSAGFIASFLPIAGIFVLSSLLFLAALPLALAMRFDGGSSRSIPILPLKIIRKNFPLYLSVLFRHSGAHMIWTFWPLFLQGLGANLFWIGAINAINSATQFVFMYAISQRIGYTSSVTGGLLLACLTFTSFTIVRDFWQIMPIQILLGISWSLLYVGGLKYLMERNVEKATVTGLFESVISLSSIIGPFIGAFVVYFGGYKATMLLASTLAFAGFLMFKLIKSECSSMPSEDRSRFQKRRDMHTPKRLSPTR
jgi:DHA1 family quinolone resistance protein-like MFS transporter